MGKCTRVHEIVFSLSNVWTVRQHGAGREERPITRKEVARLAGVSEATVSRVLSGTGPVKEETRRKVLEAAERLHYVPSALAQRFARRKSGNLGVILPLVPKVRLFSTYYFSEILSGVGEEAGRHGYDLLLMFRKPDEKREYAMLFRTQKVDALIVLGSRDEPDERQALAELWRDGYPFCLVNQRFDEEPFPAVDADHESGSFQVVRHLAGQGCRRIAFVNGPLVYSNSADRLAGYRRALEASGLPFDPNRIYAGNYSRKSGLELAASIADAMRQGEVDGIFAGNDRMAIGIMQGLREFGLEAGADYALAGCDDSEGARMTDPQLTTLSVPFDRMGKLAARRLLAADETTWDTPILKLPVELIVRASTERFGSSSTTD